MRTSDFDYELPRELIATHPAVQRDESRLLVLGRKSGKLEDHRFRELESYLESGDLLVMNNSRVIKARLRGVRRSTGAAVELLLLHPHDAGAGQGHGAAGSREAAAGIDSKQVGAEAATWVAMCRPARKARVGEWLDFPGSDFAAQVVAEGADGERVLQVNTADVLGMLERFGDIPLPPYIVQRRKEIQSETAATGPAKVREQDAGAAPGFDKTDDAVRYQTVYAREPGSVAAPTAGLHFTPELMERLRAKGVALAWVTLHVGAGTFKPVEVEDPAQHPIHAEFCEVPEETARAIADARQRGGRVVAVGTTTVRTLESAWDTASQQFRQGQFSTRLLILPGYEFRVVQGMVTNFHLPKSSLLMMVSAFAGHASVMNAYRHAIEEGYRFYSFGDAMLMI